ncbi:MAG: deoxynucleoside kinase [Eubacterium ventriosum]|jgi:dTMP kinase
MFVSIEGCISAGKSTLSKLLSDCLEYKLVLEDYKSNRFLENFYTENNKEISFATEMEFLLLHYQQLINIDYSKNIISDFSFFSNIVFGRLNLEEGAKRIFLQAHNYLNKTLPKPNLVVLLQGNTDLLYQRIKERRQIFDENISYEYLSRVNDFYNFEYEKMLRQYGVDYIVLNIDKYDFVANKELLQELCSNIIKRINK